MKKDKSKVSKLWGVLLAASVSATSFAGVRTCQEADLMRDAFPDLVRGEPRIHSMLREMGVLSGQLNSGNDVAQVMSLVNCQVKWPEEAGVPQDGMREAILHNVWYDKKSNLNEMGVRILWETKFEKRSYSHGDFWVAKRAVYGLTLCYRPDVCQSVNILGLGRDREGKLFNPLAAYTARQIDAMEPGTQIPFTPVNYLPLNCLNAQDPNPPLVLLREKTKT